MAPRNKRPGAGLHRIDAALDAMRPLGFPARLVRKSVKELLKVYGDEGWAFIEDGAYRVLIDAMLDEQKGSDHEHDHEGKSVQESCNLQAKTEASEAGQFGKMVCDDHDGDDSINELGMHDNQMENQGRDLDQTFSFPISTVAEADTPPQQQQQQQHQGRVHFGFSPTSSLLQTLQHQGRVHFGFSPSSTVTQTDSVSSYRRRKPCYGWISEDDEEEEEDNVGSTK